MNKILFLLLFWNCFASHLEEIILIKNILDNNNHKNKKKNISIDIKNLLKIYWKMKPKSFIGYGLDYNNNFKYFEGLWNWQEKFIIIKIIIDDNCKNYNNNYLLMNNKNDSNIMEIEYFMNNYNQLLIYKVLQTRYLKFINQYQWDLSVNGLNFINDIMDKNTINDYINNLSLEYTGSYEKYNFYSYPNKEFYIFLVTKNQQLKFFIIYRKLFSLHKIIIVL